MFTAVTTFIIGTGNIFCQHHPHIYREEYLTHRQQHATAIDTAKVALAPKFDLYSVPSKTINDYPNLRFDPMHPNLSNACELDH